MVGGGSPSPALARTSRRCGAALEPWVGKGAALVGWSARAPAADSAGLGGSARWLHEPRRAAERAVQNGTSELLRGPGELIEPLERSLEIGALREHR